MASTTKRRRFQAPITAFFTKESLFSDTASPSQYTQTHQEPLSSPALPHEIQSSLLTVGMRIRKSVPEGYKTHKTLQSSAFYGPSKYSLESRNQDDDCNTSPTFNSTYAELTPFCGLHKIGGMAVQPMPAAGSDRFLRQRGALQAEEWDPWSLPSSQESTDSNVIAAPSNKRTFAFDQEDDDDDDDEEAVFGNAFPSQNPSSDPFSHARMPDLNSFSSPPTSQPFTCSTTSLPRAFAIPRSRFPRNKETRPALEGQENPGPDPKGLELGVSRSGVDNEVDFEDAHFLAAREDVDMDRY